jgi:hypothetical protein
MTSIDLPHGYLGDCLAKKRSVVTRGDNVEMGNVNVPHLAGSRQFAPSWHMAQLLAGEHCVEPCNVQALAATLVSA